METSTTSQYNLSVNFNTTLSPSASWSITNPQIPRRSGPLPPDLNFRLALYVLMGMVALVGIVGNVCVCFIVIRGKKMYTIANLFLMNLALADIFVLSICYPLTIIRNEMDWPFGEVLCKILPSLSDSFYGVSMGCITAIAIYRYRMILYPMTTHISFAHAKITLIIIWVLALCVISVPLCWILKLETYKKPIQSPKTTMTNNSTLNSSYHASLNATIFMAGQFLIGSGPNGQNSSESQTFMENSTSQKVLETANSNQPAKYITISKCISRWPSPKFREIYQIVQISWYILPLSVILFTYLRIRSDLRKTLRYDWTKTGDNAAPQSCLTGRVMGIKRALTLLAPVVVTFAILMFPWNLFRLLSLVMNLSKIKHIYTYLDVAAAMMVTNSCSNPFIYYIMSKDFREEFRRHFRLFKQCYKLRPRENIRPRSSLKSASSFKTREETIAADEQEGDRNSLDNSNGSVFSSSWEKYAVRKEEPSFATIQQKQFPKIDEEAKSTNESAKLLEPVFDPDRETII